MRLRAWITQDQRDWLDVDGRPLGERSSPLYPSDTVEVVCPYSGARRGRPMNETARLQVLANRDAGLATLVAALPERAVAADLLRTCTAITLAPYVHPRPTPAAVSAAYKTNLGFQQVLLALHLDTLGLAGTPVEDLPDAATLLAALEAGRWLVGQQQACAGSPGEIALAWETMCRRRAPPEADRFAIADPDWSLQATALVVALVLATGERLTAGDRDGLDGYGADAPIDTWPLGARLWHRPPAPWVVAATARVGRPATAVRNLFREEVPAIEHFLAGTGSHTELERRFWEAAKRLPAER
jgi:hypothetical protein